VNTDTVWIRAPSHNKGADKECVYISAVLPTFASRINPIFASWPTFDSEGAHMAERIYSFQLAT